MTRDAVNTHARPHAMPTTTLAVPTDEQLIDAYAGLFGVAPVKDPTTGNVVLTPDAQTLLDKIREAADAFFRSLVLSGLAAVNAPPAGA